MGFRFRKRIKIAPGVKLNVTAKGLSSVSLGGKGFTLNAGKAGVKTTASIHGTGLSCSENLTSSTKKHKGSNIMAMIKCDECGQEISKKAEKCPKCGAPKKKKASVFTWIITIVLVFWMIGYFSKESERASSAPSISPKEIAMKNVKLDLSWTKKGLGSVMEADFTISNNSEYAVKDVEITCTHYAKSGTKIDGNSRTIYDSFPAKNKKTIKKFNMGFIHSQATQSSCSITDLKV